MSYPNEFILKLLINSHQQLKQIDYKGYDVFDGLNSQIFKNSPFYKSRLMRLIWIQFFKQSPINFRYLLAVKKDYNPKALALFISTYINLAKFTKNEKWCDEATNLFDILYDLRSTDYNGLSWGYNFDWQARAFFVPAYKPNMVCTVFSGQAILDLYEFTNDRKWLDFALEIVHFILEYQIINEDESSLCFAYIKGENAVVHNVTFMAAAFLSRLFSITREESLKVKAAKSIHFGCQNQNMDGSWAYGKQKHHKWIDNFHTGYNLTSINDYQIFCEDNHFDDVLLKGIQYHIKNHFDESSFLPKYTNVNLYPLDIHNFAQALVSSIKLSSLWPNVLSFQQKNLKNLFSFMYDNKHKYFYYQCRRYYAIKINYIRWAQAWVIYSLSLYLNYDSKK